MSIQIEVSIDGQLKNYVIEESEKRKVPISNIIINMIKEQQKLQKKYLDHGYYICNHDLYNRYGDKVNLTYLERTLLNCLYDNSPNTVSVQEIRQQVWENRKFSIHSLRNIVAHIRNKTFFNIISSTHKEGYYIK